MKIPILKNKDGVPSYTTTITVIGFFVINLKLLFSGISLPHDIKMSEFSGVDYAAALSAIGGIHLWNKTIVRTKNKDDDSNGS